MRLAHRFDRFGGRVGATLSALALLAACGGGGGGLVPRAAVGPLGAKASAHLVIRVPKRRAAGRRPRYVSPATQSLTLAIAGPTPLNETVNLTPTSTGCTSSVTATTCALTLVLAPGNYTALLTAYDALGGTGNALSTAQNVAFVVKAGQANTIALTLAGIPAQIVVVPLGTFGASGPNGTIDLIGQVADSFLVEALDADGNIIAGAGAPTFTVTQSGGALTPTLTAPTTTSPNLFTLKPPSVYSAATATLAITASFAGQATNGCPTVAACSTSVTVAMVQMLVVADFNDQAVKFFRVGSTVPFASDPQSNFPNTIAVDPAGDVFVGLELAPDVLEYGTGSTTVTRTIDFGGTTTAGALATDSAGNLFVATCDCTGGELDEYPPGATTPSRTIATFTDLDQIATDASGNVYATDRGNGTLPSTLSVFVPGATTPSRSVLLTTPDTYTGVTAGAGGVFATTDDGEVFSYPLGLGAQMTVATGLSSPLFPVVDPTNGNVFVTEIPTETVLGFTPTGSLAATIVQGIDGPTWPTFDSLGTLYVSNSYSSNGGVTIYPLAGTLLSQTIPTGGVAAIAIVP